jgi:hypothetical protein
MNEPDAFDPELRDLLRGEVDGKVFSDEATARILGRLETSIPGLAPSHGAIPQARAPAHLLATKMGIAIASAVIGGLVAAGAMRAMRAIDTGAPPRVVYVDRVVTASASAPATPIVVPAVPSAAVSAIVPSSIPSSAPAPSGGDGSAMRAERLLVDEARTAYARGESDVALAALSRHAARYPAGALVEEREALAIRVLVDLGRYEEGRTRGRRFRVRFPKSLMLPAVEAALDSIP